MTAQLASATYAPTDFFGFFDTGGPAQSPTASATTKPSLVLPPFALDGRPITWNADRTACTLPCSATEYHSDKLAVSASALRRMQRSPAHYLAYASSANQQTAARRWGTALHTAVPEPALFQASYVVWSGKRRGKAWQSFQSANAGKEILTQTEYDEITKAASVASGTVIVEGTGGNEYTVGDLVTLGEVEKTYYWLDQESGLTCKARMDLVVQHVSFDLKSTGDARRFAFERHAATDGYDIQAAFYARARVAMEPSIKDMHRFIFVAVEATAPHATVAHPADLDEFMKFGDRKVGSLLSTFKQCRVSGHWPAYGPEGGTLKLPLHARYPAAANLDI